MFSFAKGGQLQFYTDHLIDLIWIVPSVCKVLGLARFITQLVNVGSVSKKLTSHILLKMMTSVLYGSKSVSPNKCMYPPILGGVSQVHLLNLHTALLNH